MLIFFYEKTAVKKNAKKTFKFAADKHKRCLAIFFFVKSRPDENPAPLYFRPTNIK